jgi:hypothetical protein
MGNYTVRFRLQGQDFELSTGSRDESRAALTAAELYAARLQGREVGNTKPARARRELDHIAGLAPIEPPATSGVYAIRGAGGWVKIGKAKNIRKRLQEIQSSQPLRVHLVAILSEDLSTESLFHERFASLRGFGEWFELRGELLAALLAHAGAA